MAKNKKTEISVEEKLRALYDLQLIDSKLDEIKSTRGELPLEVEDLKADIAGKETRLGKKQDEVKEVNNDINVQKELMKQSKALIKKYASQQDNVRNNREFEALSKEIEYQELEIKASEKKIKKFKDLIEFKEDDIKELKKKIKGYKDHLKHKKGELDTIVKETEKAEKLLAKKREGYTVNIEPRLLKAYEKIRGAVKNGLAVVPVERGASAGSFFAIPPQRQMEIANRRKIIIDEHSGRILVDAELANEEKEKMSKLLK